MRQPEYAAGYAGFEPGEWRVHGEPGNIEHARMQLAELIREDHDADWLIDASLVRRDGPNHPWEKVKDPARETATAVMLALAEDARRIGDGIVQGTDLHRMFTKAARALSASANPQEYES